MEHIVIEEQATQADREAVYAGLRKYNLAHFENTDCRDLDIIVKDDAGNVVAGLCGDTHGNWLEVDYLWVDDSLRGQHLGSQLLLRAEAIARERGCISSVLFTFGFQAPVFYERHGYVRQFVLADFPVSGTMNYYTKKL